MIERGKVCVSISASDPTRALSMATSAAKNSDVIEIRLDGMNLPLVQEFTKKLEVPLLFTCRPDWEGGNYTGTEEERIALLELAAKEGADFVDIELKTADKLRAKLISSARGHQTKTIVSWHDFKTTPSTQALTSILQDQYRSGADIGKIVTTARNFQDVLRVLSLQDLASEMGFPLCAFCMGRIGMISRLATLELGGFMSYAAPDNGEPTAAGQLSVSAMRKSLECFNDGD
jgi:3-dehydroquinate dehydratase-1